MHERYMDNRSDRGVVLDSISIVGLVSCGYRGLDTGVGTASDSLLCLSMLLFIESK